MKNWIMNWVGPKPALDWLSAEEGGWGVKLLDLRKSAVETMATTTSREVAETFVALQDDDGQGFRHHIATGPRVACQLHYPVEQPLGDGILFTATAMEDKWALYLYDSRILCVRSWTGQVSAVATTRQEPTSLLVTAVQGDLGLDESLLVRAFDFLMRSHALGQPYPAPLDGKPDANTALRYFSMFGRRAQCAAEAQPIAGDPPALRSISLLHLACVREQTDLVAQCLQEGYNPRGWASDGGTPLQWAAVAGHDAAFPLLLAGGASLEDPGRDGSTVLMRAVERKNAGLVANLLARGANAQAADHGGFTALHRASEMGLLDIAKQLLEAGASPTTADHSGQHTPLTLAGDQQMKSLLRPSSPTS